MLQSEKNNDLILLIHAVGSEHTYLGSIVSNLF